MWDTCNDCNVCCGKMISRLYKSRLKPFLLFEIWRPAYKPVCEGGQLDCCAMSSFCKASESDSTSARAFWSARFTVAAKSSSKRRKTIADLLNILTAYASYKFCNSALSKNFVKTLTRVAAYDVLYFLLWTSGITSIVGLQSHKFKFRVAIDI